MTVSYKLDENNVIIWWGFPLVKGLPTLEVEYPDSQIHVGFSQIINDEFVENFEAYEADRLAKIKEAEKDLPYRK